MIISRSKSLRDEHADHDLRATSLSWLGDAAILLSATAGTVLTLNLERPRTAVLIYLLGVMFVGARSGLYRGVLAALIASFVYNFFLSEPVFRLGATSLDELVPLLAFNVSAIVSGGLAGRLKDSAGAARAAEAKNYLLLQLSDQLQRAINPTDVVAIARTALRPSAIEDVGIDLQEGNEAHSETATAGARDIGTLTSGRAFEDFTLYGSRGTLGTARFVLDRQDRDRGDEPDLKAVANLLALALDRCILQEQLSETLAAQRSEELKSALLSSVSHDLRTPLTAIEAAATSLRAFPDTLSPDQKDEMLATISEQCAKLNRYTAGLLDMGRIQAGIPNSQFTNVDVVEILGVALGSIRKRFPEQEICKEVPVAFAVIQANAAMLEQIIFNLLENAIVHGGEGQPILVRLTLNRVDCFLEISDNGPGIPATEQARVFDRFYRGRKPVHREGSGLGLYIAKGFVEAFGGTIEIQSPVIEKIGTNVTVSLPLLQGAHRVPEILDADTDR
jgi:two-component system sensor histidine kinase KdpD